MDDKIGTVYPPRILNKSLSETKFFILLSLIVASETPNYIIKIEALEMIASCLNPPKEANRKPKLAYIIIDI